MFALERALMAHMRPVAVCRARDTLPKLPVPRTLSIVKSLRLHCDRDTGGSVTCSSKSNYVKTVQPKLQAVSLLHASIPDIPCQHALYLTLYMVMLWALASHHLPARSQSSARSNRPCSSVRYNTQTSYS